MARPVPFHNPNAPFQPSSGDDNTFYNSGNNQWGAPQPMQFNMGGVPQPMMNSPGMGVHHSPHHHQQPHHQPQQQQHPMSGGRPGQPQSDMFSNISSNPMHQYAANQAFDMLRRQTGNYLPGAYGAWNALRYYFAVNNSYVLNKMKVLLLPFRHKAWRRQMLEDAAAGTEGNQQQGRYVAPAHDINAPDLYIPLMSFVTYILIVGYTEGASGEFSPDIIGEVGSYCMAIQIVEVLMLKFGLSMLLQCQVPFLDLVAFTGYKYVGLVINMTGGIVLGRVMYYACLTYTGAMISYFMLNSLKGVVPEVGRIGRNKRNYSLLGLSFGQFVLMWWMAYNGKL